MSAIEDDLKIYVSASENYFRKVTNSEVELQLPYPYPADFVFPELTGFVQFHGERRGGVLFSATRDDAAHIAKAMFGGMVPDPAIIHDIVGEAANAIAGNAQELSSLEYDIAAPEIFEQLNPDIDELLPPPQYVLPFHRGANERYFVVVGLS